MISHALAGSSLHQVTASSHEQRRELSAVLAVMKTVPVQKAASRKPSNASPLPLPPPVVEGQRHHLNSPAAKSLFGLRPESAGRKSEGATNGQSHSINALLARVQISSGKQKPKAVYELSTFLASVQAEAAASTYQECILHKLLPALAHSVSEQDLQKESLMAQAVFSCIANLSCLGGPRNLIDSRTAVTLVSALSNMSAGENLRAALACIGNLSKCSMCVQLLRAQQAEPALKLLSKSHEVNVRVPAAAALRAFQEVPDSTLQTSSCTLGCELRRHLTQFEALMRVSIKLLFSATELSNDCLSAIHGIARSLSGLSPTSAVDADVQEASAALALCEQEHLARKLVSVLDASREIRSSQDKKDDSFSSRPGSALDSPRAKDPSKPARNRLAIRSSSFTRRLGRKSESNVGASGNAGGDADLPEQLAFSCLANLTAIGGGPCVQPHGGVRCLLWGVGLSGASQRFAVIGLSNCCPDADSVEEVKASSESVQQLRAIVAAKTAEVAPFAARILAHVDGTLETNLSSKVAPKTTASFSFAQATGSSMSEACDEKQAEKQNAPSTADDARNSDVRAPASSSAAAAGPSTASAATVLPETPKAGVETVTPVAVVETLVVPAAPASAPQRIESTQVLDLIEHDLSDEDF